LGRGRGGSTQRASRQTNTPDRQDITNLENSRERAILAALHFNYEVG